MLRAPSDLTLRNAALVAAGAVTGGVGRFLVVDALPGSFPFAVTAVNVLGSFLVGAIAFGAFARGRLRDDARLFLAMGVLGAFTTMSGFASATVALVDEGRALMAGVMFLVNPLLSLVAVLTGRAVASTLPGGDAA